jgi:predicted AlkP superfamily pyrophosphatase or phosphodiesterase
MRGIGRSAWRRPAGALVSIAVLIALAFAFTQWSPRERPVERESALDGWRAPWPDLGLRPSSPPPRKWIVVGWDGASWSVVLPLLQAGRLPHLEALMRDGSYGSLWTVEPTTSPSIWTTIATGVSPARHGILGFQKPSRPWDAALRLWPGRHPASHEFFSNADRRTKALWNIVSDHDRSVVAVGYHNTFPAEQVRGAMIANYLVQQDVLSSHAGAPAADSRTAAFVYPKTLAADLHGWVRAPRDLTFPEVQRFAAVDGPEFDDLMARYGDSGDKHWSYLLKAFAYDEFTARAAAALEERFDPDFLLVHFQSTDWAGHNFLYFDDPGRFAGLKGSRGLRLQLAAESARYAGTLAAFYVYVDEWLGRLAGARGADTAVLVLSDHGMEPDVNPLKSGTHNGAPAGLFVVSGPGIRSGHRVEGATVYDILPTLMASVGLPVAADLEGRVLTEALEPRVLRGGWPRVDSYESGTRFRPRVEMDARTREQVEEELRGLGYIQ